MSHRPLSTNKCIKNGRFWSRLRRLTTTDSTHLALGTPFVMVYLERYLSVDQLTGMDRPIERKSWTRKRTMWLVAIVMAACLVVYGLISVGGSSTIRLESERLTISEVAEGAFQEFIPVSGTVSPLKTFFLDAAQGGRVSEIYLEEGAMVDKGDSILRLDNTDLRLDIMYREAQLFEQINNLRNTRLAMEQNSLQLRGDLLEVDRRIGDSRRTYEVALTLKDKNLISVNELERTREEYEYWTGKRELTIESRKQDSVLRSVQLEQLEASVSRMQANLEVVRQRLDELVLRAPIAGQLTALDAQVGESKSMGQRLGQIDVLDGVKLQADVDEYYVSRISPGQAGGVTIDDVNYRLRVGKVYPEVSGGKFKTDLQFVDPPPPHLRRGQTLQVRLMLGDLAQAVLLPRGGFYNSTGGRWAYVVAASGTTASRRDIELGRQNTEVYEVLSGLRPGERVITSSYETFAQYDKIVIKQ
jgi:HlyD family secretion protein